MDVSGDDQHRSVRDALDVSSVPRGARRPPEPLHGVRGQGQDGAAAQGDRAGARGRRGRTDGQDARGKQGNLHHLQGQCCQSVKLQTGKTSGRGGGCCLEFKV